MAWRKLGARVFGWIIRPPRLFGVALFVLGLPGLLEDVEGWGEWLRRLSNFVEAAIARIGGDLTMSYFYQPWVYWGLLAGGAFLILEAEKLIRFSRWVKGRVGYAIAVQMSQKHFIAKDAAIAVVRNSRWARSRRDLKTKPQNILDHYLPLADINPARNARNSMFYNWCSKALERFEMLNEEDATRNIGGKIEYDEIKLKEWLEEKYSEDLFEEFGPI